MTTTELFDAFTSLRSGSRDGQRLPHKPLLVLQALGRWENGDRGPIPFRDIEQKLEELIRTYGPRGAGNPQEPFWRLKRDGIWVLGGTERLPAPSAVEPPALRDLREGVTGQFAEDVRLLLSADPALVGHLARVILECNFPPSLHADIAADVGLDLSESPSSTVTTVVKKRVRNPNFRDSVLRAYGDRCALCGVGMRILRSPLGVEAAHVRWFAFDGPDDVTNGIALCALHHKAFDLGAFTIEPGGRVLVSEHLTGDGMDVLLRGSPLYLEQTKVTSDRPAPEFLAWHRETVFKGRAQG